MFFLERGFSLIEVLVALFLLAVVLLGFSGFQYQHLQVAEQAYLQTEVLEQLRSMAVMVRIRSSNLDQLIDDWKAQNKNLLSHAYSTVTPSVLRIRWLSGGLNWHCQIKPIKNYACIELRLA